MTKQLNDVEIALILEDFKAGMSQREIASKRHRSRSAIGQIVKKHMTGSSFNRKKGSGRKQTLTIIQKKFLIEIYDTDHFRSYSKMSKMIFEKFQKIVSAKTISRFFQTQDIFTFHASNKPLLSQKNIAKRKQAAEKFLGIGKEEVQRIIFSDECKFNLFHSDGMVFVHRKRGERLFPENVKKTIKHEGGNVMVWGCISSKGVGNLEIIDYTMDAARYKQLLANNLKQSAAKMGLNDYVFMHDNDPKHTSKLVKSYLLDEKVKVLDWPAQSPDLNPIEHIWAYMKSKIYDQNLLSKNQIIEKIKLIWNSITPDMCKKYCDSFQNRAYAVYKAKGMHTSY